MSEWSRENVIKCPASCGGGERWGGPTAWCFKGGCFKGGCTSWGSHRPYLVGDNRLMTI